MKRRVEYGRISGTQITATRDSEAGWYGCVEEIAAQNEQDRAGEEGMAAGTRRERVCALQLLEYCHTTREIGIMFSRGLDKHGVNLLYAYADSTTPAGNTAGEFWCSETLPYLRIWLDMVISEHSP